MLCLLTSFKNNRIFLVNQVLVEAPCYDTAETFTHDPWSETPEVADGSLLLIDLYYRIRYASVVLSLVFIVILKVGPRTNQI